MYGASPIGIYPGQYYDEETGLHYNWHRYYDSKTGRYLIPDPIGQAAGINFFTYARNNTIGIVDPTGLTWGESLGMFWDWITGTGPDVRTFGPGSNQVIDLMDAPGVKKAREAFYQKNAARFLEARNPCEESPSLQPLTNYDPGFGLKGLWQAGFDPTEQFVGNYRVDIIPTADGSSIEFVITNTTSMTSFLYGIGPSWSRAAFRPGGNMTQTYTWKEAIRR
jgi:RHS repeat-associated protein